MTSSVQTPPAAPAEPASTSPTGSRLLDWSRQFRLAGLVLVLVLLVVATTAANPRFLSGQGVRDLLLAAALTVLLAAGMTLVILTKGIDLSVGSVLGLSAFGTGTVLSTNPDLPVIVAVLVGVGIGAVCGLVNGALVAFGRVPPLVATLGTLYVFRGLVYFWAGGSRISAGDLPRSFLDLGTGHVLGVPYLMIVALVVLLVTGMFLGRYRAGRDLYAIGSNPEAAQLAGIPITRRLVWAYVAAGAMAGLGGVLYAARFGTVDASAGSGLELDIVAAAVVGGVAIFGGSGTVYGAALGALILTVINNALPALGIDQFWQRAIVGALIVGAIGLDRLVSLRLDASLRRSASHVR